MYIGDPGWFGYLEPNVLEKYLKPQNIKKSKKPKIFSYPKSSKFYLKSEPKNKTIPQILSK